MTQFLPATQLRLVNINCRGIQKGNNLEYATREELDMIPLLVTLPTSYLLDSDHFPGMKIEIKSLQLPHF